MIQTIIFDLGGVILNINPSFAREAFKHLGITDIEKSYEDWKMAELFKDHEKGIITNDEFRQGIRKHIPREVEDQDIDNAWNSMVLDIPQHRINMLLELKKKYRTILLSNTNFIHIEHWNQYLKNNTQYSSLHPLFHKVYFSCDMGKRKPDPAIFQQVIDECELQPSSVMFVDDYKHNIEGAIATGIHAVWHDPTLDIAEQIQIYLDRFSKNSKS